MHPDTPAVEEMLDSPRECFTQLHGAVLGETDQVDDDFGVEPGDQVAKSASGVLSLPIDLNRTDPRPSTRRPVRTALSTTQQDHVVTAGNQLRDQEGADVARSTDDDGSHDRDAN